MEYKCDNCGEKHDRIHIVIECRDCYVNGWKKQWERDREKAKKEMKEFEDEIIKRCEEEDA